MKKEIIIISDLWGAGNATWLNNFQHQLLSHYKIKFYDACKLGQIDTSQYEEAYLHQQFLDFGIDNAIDNLIRLEKEAKIFIGCSIGGVIAWKAALAGLPIEHLTAFSSTRLRKESDAPDCKFKLLYGKNDPNKPDLIWLEAFAKSKYQLIEGDHNIYQDKETVKQVLQELIPNG